MSLFSETALCGCGCGLPAPLASQTDRKRGYVKGQPRPFRVGHNHRPGRVNGYERVYRPEHPKARHGTVGVHTLRAETALGRLLPAGAEVHHVDGDHLNNANANLVICQDHAFHKLLHYRTKVVRAGGNPNTDKFCRDCYRVKPLADFNARHANQSSGRQPICRACSKVRDAAARARRSAAHTLHAGEA